MWTRGNAAGDVVFSGGNEWIDADLQAGPIRTVVELRTSSWSDRADLAPGERRRIKLPANVAVTVKTVGAFRPIDYDPAARDSRRLGVRIEFPE